MNNKSMIALTIGIIVLTIGIILLTIFKGENMWKWILENVCCCVGKKNEYENIENGDERKEREVVEEYTKDMKEGLKGLKEAVNTGFGRLDAGFGRLDAGFDRLDAGFDRLDAGYVKMQDVYNAGLDEIKLLLEKRPAELNDEKKNQIINNN